MYFQYNAHPICQFVTKSQLEFRTQNFALLLESVPKPTLSVNIAPYGVFWNPTSFGIGNETKISIHNSIIKNCLG